MPLSLRASLVLGRVGTEFSSASSDAHAVAANYNLQMQRRGVNLPLGGLAGLPWGHLPTLTGQPVTVAPSAAAWLRATRQPDQVGPVVAELTGQKWSNQLT